MKKKNESLCLLLCTVYRNQKLFYELLESRSSGVRFKDSSSRKLTQEELDDCVDFSSRSPCSSSPSHTSSRTSRHTVTRIPKKIKKSASTHAPFSTCHCCLFFLWCPRRSLHRKNKHQRQQQTNINCIWSVAINHTKSHVRFVFVVLGVCEI